MSLGIATIYQELDLVAGLTVADNIFLGRETLPVRHHPARRGQPGRRPSCSTRLGHPEIRPTAEVGSLSAAAQQMVSIARALSQDAKLIIMDEPSAVLDNEEVERLFGVIRDLTAHDVAVVYISHRLEEIRQIGDRITVLKDGRTVATGLPARDTPTREVITLMTGRTIEYVFPPRRRRAARRRGAAARGRGARPARAASPTSPSPSAPARSSAWPGWSGPAARRSSRPSTAPAAPPPARSASAGRRLRAGDVGGRGRRRRRPGAGGAQEPGAAARRLRLPEHHASPAWAASPAAASSSGGAERAAAREQVEALDVRPADVDREVRTLSGGNQQKVVLARWLLRDCRVLLLDEPTRGVDVGARSEIYALVRDLADRGVAVVVVSSEIPEVLGLADRVLVDRRRRRRRRGAGRRARRAPGARPDHGGHGRPRGALRPQRQHEGDVA